MDIRKLCSKGAGFNEKQGTGCHERRVALPNRSMRLSVNQACSSSSSQSTVSISLGAIGFGGSSAGAVYFPPENNWCFGSSSSTAMGDDDMSSSPVEESRRERTSMVRLGREAWAQQPFAVSHKIRLVHILKNLHTSEVKIYSDASREFIELLDGESGGQVLQEFVQQSPRLVELLEAWRLHREKPGMVYILSLFATVLGHPDGKLRRHGLVKKNLDAVARMILEDKEKWGDVLLELSSGDSRRQNAALDLMAAIIRRGGGLASEIAERFDFKMAILPQLAGTIKKKGGFRDGGNRRKVAEVGSTRRSFIRFAMSFLEVGNPRLLRWVLQQKEVYSGVLRGIGNDDAETIIYVLSTLRDNVLVEESLVPPGLRSVLFGSATLEQLSLISGNLDAGVAADVAHEVLVTVCTDPKNGLMPSMNLRGNEKRLLDLMKKLKATEITHHRSLLLAIVKKRLSLCSAYINGFPYTIEPRSSLSWFAAITLAADMISSAKCEGIVHTLSSNLHGLVSVDDEEVQVVLKCIVPHVCSRAVINRGLLHSDDLVKHGSLRLVFESVNLLCYVIKAINGIIATARVKSEFNGSSKVTVRMDSFPLVRCSDAADAPLVDEVHQGDELHVKRWISLREYIQDEVRGAMPDPQVLLKLLSSASQKHQNHSLNIQKKDGLLSEPPQKKQRCDAFSAVDDIIIGGIDVEQDKDTPEDLDMENDHASILCKIWGLDKEDPKVKEAKVIDDVFHSKLLDVLRLYLRVMPSSFDGSFDFFRVIPPNPLDLSKEEQQSLLSLLLEYSGQSEGCWDPERVPESMYKHLQPLIYIMLHSQIKSTRDQAYILVKAAMASSGAFDLNFAEIDAWLLDSESGSMKLHEKAMISLYVCNTIHLILQSQVDVQLLRDLIGAVLNERFEKFSSEEMNSRIRLAEWRPLINLLHFLRRTSDQQSCSLFAALEHSSEFYANSLSSVTGKVEEMLSEQQSNSLDDVATTFLFSVLCAPPKDIISGFSNILAVVKKHFPCHLAFLSSVLYLQHDYLAKVASCWPDMLCGIKLGKGDFNVDNLETVEDEWLKPVSAESASVSAFLSVSPFCALLPSVLNLASSAPGKIREAYSNALLRLLQDKLSECSFSEVTLDLRSILFWSHHLLSSYSIDRSNTLEQLCHLCSALADSVFERIQVLIADIAHSKYAGLSCPVQCMQDIIDSVLQHPIIALSLSGSLSSYQDLADGSLEHLEEALTVFSKERPHEDGAILLLPAALSYLNCHTDGDGQLAEFLAPIPIFYSGILLGDNGFSRWENFVTRSIFEEDFSGFAPSSLKEAMIYFSETLLGKTVIIFSDPITIKAIRCILVILSQGNIPADEILELILGHSSFVSTITCSETSANPSACNTAGGLLQPCPSILKFVDSFTEENKPLISVAEKRRIETIRLLRLLYDLKSRQQNNILLNESRELVFLLLSAYGATLGDTDLEILHLMNEIESSECRTIAEVDHLWGNAALKFKEELKLDFSKLDTHDMENVEVTERRKALFRENIPIDSKLCAKTALQYCYKRSSRASAFSLEQLRRDSFADSFEVTSQTMDMTHAYDPMFILRFSIHTLLMGYLEPTEFSRLGLLAITLASQKSKETWQLQLLLTYLQNGISEQWQRIPSIIAVFAAEASLTVLDSSHTQFTVISNHLMHSTSVNLQSIPLFPTLLRSSSVHFKAERLWMLRLLYAGSNLSDDAKIYKRGNGLELALAFCSSPVSDSESQVLVLKVLKKCMKLPVLAHHLVKDCGLLLWLSSVILIHHEGSDGVENTCSKVTELALEVVNDLISSRLITDWLQESALEQLSAISSYLYVLLDKDAKLLKGNVPLLISVLRVITSTMRLSMKRKIYQPHFTLSIHGIFSICQAIGGSSRRTGFKLAIELGIDAILMNGPLPILSEMDKSRISVVVSWAILNMFWLHSQSSAVNKYLCDNRSTIEMLFSKIRCPSECNPAWRWHYYQPWKDPALQKTEIDRMEEEQACRSLLIIFSNAFSAGQSDFPVLSLDDIEKSGLFGWERDTIVKQP
ncbi:hypothetical protein PR202_gb14324 [Eleusine coracana subsp. coracana]|uniref:Nucleolar pre-ribosomal-associated protein 1 C-terminal domain-containing protein n=1 Tax=Eleusine coracana subsp. coracana TaxID=191504 RepID=A0AAV5EV35_ELECO|nr:hypothetical protein PR202_gb14324 [Eleusine coracana subsp. coracana]